MGLTMSAAHLHALDAVDDLHIKAQLRQQALRVLPFGGVLWQADQVSLGRRLRVPPALLLAPTECLPRLREHMFPSCNLLLCGLTRHRSHGPALRCTIFYILDCLRRYCSRCL